MREIQLVNQINDKSCVHACIAMLTGTSVQDYWDRYPHPLTSDQELTLLIEGKIMPRSIAYPIGGTQFPLCGIYFISVPSINVAGVNHRVVVVCDENEARIYDPQSGREGKNFYPLDAFYRGENTVKGYGSVALMDFDALADLRVGGDS